MGKITRSAKAGDDLKGIFNYIADNSSVSQATKFLKTLESRMQKLADTPGMGRKRDDLEPGLLSLPSGKYLIFYQQTDGGIQVIRVIHSSRDIEQQFEGANK